MIPLYLVAYRGASLVYVVRESLFLSVRSLSVGWGADALRAGGGREKEGVASAECTFTISGQKVSQLAIVGLMPKKKDSDGSIL